MEPERQRPWLRSAPNELIVNSILAAISTIVVQTIVTSGDPKYGTPWLLTAFSSLLLFVISAEQLGEAIREVDIRIYIRSSILYNIGVLLLFLSLWAIFERYTDWKGLWAIIVLVVVILSWAWFWGWDMAFLIFPGEHYDRWKRKMDGEVVEGEILDHYDIFLARITRWRR